MQPAAPGGLTRVRSAGRTHGERDLAQVVAVDVHWILPFSIGWIGTALSIKAGEVVMDRIGRDRARRSLPFAIALTRAGEPPLGDPASGLRNGRNRKPASRNADLFAAESQPPRAKNCPTSNASSIVATRHRPR